MLEVRLIGKFDIQMNGKPVIISSRAAQSLFAYLILTAGTSHRREKLAGMFWPDAPEEKARAYLRHELWRIRKALSSRSKADYLLVDDISICFNPSLEYWLDVTVLTMSSQSETIEELMNALSVFQGELLPGFYDEWILLEREHLQAVYEQKIARLLELLQDERRWQDVLEWAERWISLGEVPEAAFRYLIIAYDTLGDHAKVVATYERCVQALHELGLEPSEQTRALPLKRTPKLNIPIPLTSFIGREKELKEVAELLSRWRLVTLTGSGGVGKTRLAIQVVADVLERFPDGVWFLDLAPLSDPTLIPNTLAGLLGLRESGEFSVPDLLVNYFRSRKSLVIFDNCEHVVEACARLMHSLLTSCEGLSILATSREVLRISGEISYRVPSLTIPGSSIRLAPNDLEKMESVQLFTERAAVIAPGFTCNSQNALDIARICQRLDGIPLAIELAAARTKVLSLEQILTRLDDRFNLLAGGSRTDLPRHQTLRATIEWSYDLLSEKEQLLFRRLAVFAGGWTLEAAEEICSGQGIEPQDILDLLAQLVNKSLVLSETVPGESRYLTGASFRYHRLETIRQFAHQKFLQTREVSRLQDRHLDYFLKKAEEIEPYLKGTEQSVWMDYLDMELDNIRLALEWSISNQSGDEALRLFGSLGWFWYIRCHIREADRWLQRGLELRGRASKNAQAKALGSAGWLNYAKGDFPATVRFHEESLDLYRELDDQEGISTQLQFLGVDEFVLGHFVQARAYLEESLDISRKINNKSAMPRVLKQLGYFSQIEGDYTTAWRYYEEGLEICRQVQEGHLTTVVLSTIGSFALEQKNILQAREYFKEALEICIRLKNKRTIAETLLSFADVLCAEAQYAQSARLQGFAEALFIEAESLTEASLREINKTADALKMHLGGDSYQKEFDRGRTLRLEEAVAIALQQEF